MKQEEARQRLLTICNESGMLRFEVADWFGVHERTLYRWLAGECPIPVSVMKAAELLTKAK